MLRSHALRRAVAIVLLAPGVSLLASHALSAAIAAAGLAGRLPVGLHTYVPAVDVVDVRLLELGGLLLAVPGLALVAALAGRASRGRAPRLAALLRLGGLVAGAQVLLYLSQAVLVAQVQGLPDPVPAAALALALQGLLTLTSAVSILWSARAWAGSRVTAQSPPPCRPTTSAPPRGRGPAASPSFVILDAPRRGPPSPSPIHA